MLGKTHAELLTGLPQPISEWEYWHWCGLAIIRKKEADDEAKAAAGG